MANQSALLNDARAKVAWAEGHLDEFLRQGFAWGREKDETPTSVSKVYDAQECVFIYRVGPDEDTPSDWPLIVGDILHSFRAALDYIAWQLCNLAAKGQPIKNEDVIAFPIVLGPSRDGRVPAEDVFAGSVRRVLPDVDPTHVAIVKRYQPYTWGDQADRHPFGALRRLTNIDKHRRLNITRTRPTRITVKGPVLQENFKVTRIVPANQRPDVLEPGAELVRVYGIPTGDGDPEVKMQFGSVGTAAIPGEVDVGSMLWRIRLMVRDVIEEFDRILP